MQWANSCTLLHALLTPQFLPHNWTEEKTIPGFDRELEREAARRGPAASKGKGKATGTAADAYTFQSFQTWNARDLQPPPSAAMEILHRWEQCQTAMRWVSICVEWCLLTRATCP